jgi:hypothetical protein
VRPAVGRRKGSDQHRQSRPAMRVPQRTRLSAERLRNRRTRIPSLLIRRLCRAYLRPGHLLAGLAGRFSLARVVFPCFAALYGQNQATLAWVSSPPRRTRRVTHGQTM